MRILWCITGAGEFMKESVGALSKLKADVTVFVSKAGEEVLKGYDLERALVGHEVIKDREASSPKAGKVSLGSYDAVVVSPATANTVAKIACGIADGLVTTAVALALKRGTPVFVVPTDWVAGTKEIPDFLTQGGAKVHMKPRKSDLRNIKTLEDEGIALCQNPAELSKALKRLGRSGAA